MFRFRPTSARAIRTIATCQRIPMTSRDWAIFTSSMKAWRRLIVDHFQITGDETLRLEAKAHTYVPGTDDAFMIAVNPMFKGLDERCDPDGSAPLLGQGPTKLAKYWPDAKSHIISSLPQPLRGEESVVAVIGGDMLCLGPTNTPVANIGQMLSDTHTLHPDHFAACRHAQLEDIRDLLNAVMASYKQSMYVSGPDGSAGSVQDIEVYPGTMVIVLGGHEFVGPTIAGDENEAIPISDEKVEVVRTIAKTLTRCPNCTDS